MVKYGTRNAPPPFFCAKYGKRHTLPKPTAYLQRKWYTNMFIRCKFRRQIKNNELNVIKSSAYPIVANRNINLLSQLSRSSSGLSSWTIPLSAWHGNVFGMFGNNSCSFSSSASSKNAGFVAPYSDWLFSGRTNRPRSSCKIYSHDKNTQQRKRIAHLMSAKQQSMIKIQSQTNGKCHHNLWLVPCGWLVGWLPLILNDLCCVVCINLSSFVYEKIVPYLPWLYFVFGVWCVCLLQCVIFKFIVV